MKKYMSTQARRNQILAVALKLAESNHYQTVTREQIASKVGAATGTVSRVFGTMFKLRVAIVKRAIEEECLPVIAQSLAANDVATAFVPVRIRKKALATLV